MALITQIKNLVNDSVADALGSNANITELDTTNIVSLGDAIAQFDAYEGFYGALVNRIAKTVYMVRAYDPDTRSVLRDEHEYGAFIQKVYYDMPVAVDNPAYTVATESQGTWTYSQSSPYGVTNVVGVQALIYGGQGTWSIEIMRPIEQIESAFLSESAMMGFIDGIYMAVENAYKLEQERLEADAVNTAMAHALNKGLARNLLAEYNTANPTDTLTVAQALTSADFLRFASKEIGDTIDHMGKMSTLFNSQGYATFTPKEKLVVEMLSQFENAFTTYLSSDTFHDEMVALPKHNKISFWQTTGTSWAFDDCSSISVAHDYLEEENADNTGSSIAQSGIICFLHDEENVAAYFGKRRTWEKVNERSDVVNHGEQARKGYAVDTFANSFVFYIEATESNDGD